MWPITFSTTFMNLIHVIIAKNFGNSYIKFGIMFTLHRWDITLSNLGVHKTLMFVKVSSKKICL